MNCLPYLRFLALIAACLLLSCGVPEALAADGPSDKPLQFAGIATVLPSGDLMLDGHEVTLWGIDALASDQQCWHEDRAWNCGEEALTGLRHHLAGHHVRCTAKSKLVDNKVLAQCLMKNKTKDDDIAKYLVSEGWARDKTADSGGAYATDEEHARRLGRGIWTSRFQSAEDWKSGVANYIEYQKAAPRPVSQPAAPAITQKPQ